jgi:hypothetical protein
MQVNQPASENDTGEETRCGRVAGETVKIAYVDQVHSDIELQ